MYKTISAAETRAYGGLLFLYKNDLYIIKNKKKSMELCLIKFVMSCIILYEKSIYIFEQLDTNCFRCEIWQLFWPYSEKSRIWTYQ